MITPLLPVQVIGTGAASSPLVVEGQGDDEANDDDDPSASEEKELQEKVDNEVRYMQGFAFLCCMLRGGFMASFRKKNLPVEDENARLQEYRLLPVRGKNELHVQGLGAVR